MSTPTLSESELINRVKTANDSEAITTLVHQHTGIYFDVVSRYAAAYPNVIRKADLDDDKLYNIYQFVLAFDPTHKSKTKLSTFIYERTDYLCKGLLRKGERNVLTGGVGNPSGIMHFDQSEDSFTTNAGRTVTIADETAESDVIDTANLDIAMEDIVAAAWKVCDDKRFITILNYRHLPEHGKAGLSWREIGTKMGISYEWARKIYGIGMAEVREYLGEKVA